MLSHIKEQSGVWLSSVLGQLHVNTVSRRVRLASVLGQPCVNTVSCKVQLLSVLGQQHVNTVSCGVQLASVQGQPSVNTVFHNQPEFRLEISASVNAECSSHSTAHHLLCGTQSCGPGDR